MEGSTREDPSPASGRPLGNDGRGFRGWSALVRAEARRAVQLVRDLVRRPELATLRWLILAGLAIRILLAPLTSWAGDTPSFLNAGINTVVTGSPYTTFFFNPPLGAYLQAPFLALLGLAVPFPAFVQFVPGVEPVSLVTDLATTAIPIPAALLALKLPLILADVAVGGVIFTLVRPIVELRKATWIAGAWLLNPLPIWVSAVHAEYDPLVALALIALVGALARRSAFAAGLCLGLGTMSKLFPALAIPFVLVYLLAPRTRTTGPGRWRTLAFVAAGLAAGVIPFAPVLSGVLIPLSLVSGGTSFGGLSLFVIFNPTVLQALGGPTGPIGSFARLYEFQLALGVIGIVGTAVVWFFLLHRQRGSVPTYSTSEIATALLWVSLGSVLIDPAPQSENLIGPLALLLLAAPALGRLGYGAYVALSAAGIGLYWALLTPAAYFYPLWVMLGPGAIGGANRFELAYLNAHGFLSQGWLWLLTGSVGGAAVYLAWGLAGWFAVRRAIATRGGPA